MIAPAGPVGFVGIGNMGGAMALRAAAAGVELVVFDPSPAACARLVAVGASAAASPAEVAAACALVSVVVNDDRQVREAITGEDGVIASASPGTVVAVHSTIHLDTLREVAAAAAARDVVVLDAAVTGGVDAAARGELAVLVGGDAAALEVIGPVLATYASVVVRAGDLGAGMAAKVALMVVSFGKLAATYEGLLLAAAAGVDAVELARVIAHSERQSGIHDFFLEHRAAVLAGAVDDPLHAIGRHESPKSQKDLHAALALGESLGIALPVAAAAHDEMPAVWALGG